MTPPTAAEYFPVKTLVLWLNDICNLRCTYCFLNKTHRRMSSETARKAVDFYFSKQVSGVEYQVEFAFFGGEPFLDTERMQEVVDLARQYRPNVSKKASFGVTTNGTIATPEVERVIRDAHMCLYVSLDGTPLANRARPFVSGGDSYQTVATNLPKLISWSRDTVVRMTFHPDALDLVGNVRHVLELGAPAVALCPVVEAAWHGHEQALENAYEALADWYIHEARRGHILPLEVTHALLRQWHAAQMGGTRPPRPCGIGTSLISIDPDGNIMPCHRFLHRPDEWFGTLDQPTFTEKRSPYLQIASRDMLGCNTCMAEPVCGGGCRVVAMEAGYPLASGVHPGHCLTTRAHAKAVYRIYRVLTAEDNPAFKRILQSRRPFSGSITELLLR